MHWFWKSIGIDLKTVTRMSWMLDSLDSFEKNLVALDNRVEFLEQNQITNKSDLKNRMSDPFEGLDLDPKDLFIDTCSLPGDPLGYSSVLIRHKPTCQSVEFIDGPKYFELRRKALEELEEKVIRVSKIKELA